MRTEHRRGLALRLAALLFQLRARNCQRMCQPLLLKASVFRCFLLSKLRQIHRTQRHRHPACQPRTDALAPQAGGRGGRQKHGQRLLVMRRRRDKRPVAFRQLAGNKRVQRLPGILLILTVIQMRFLERQVHYS